MTDVAHVVTQILADELGACPDRDKVHALTYLEQSWEQGLPAKEGIVLRSRNDDFCWWLMEAFAPENLAVARRVHDAIGDLFFDLCRLGGTIDWNLVFQIRRRALMAMNPTAYQVATGATKGNAKAASEMIKKFTTEREWQTNS